MLLRTGTVRGPVALATAIKTGLTGNAKFPSPNPALVAFAGMTPRRAATPVGPMPKVQGLKLSISDHPGDTD